jgi:hypothetical protein
MNTRCAKKKIVKGSIIEMIAAARWIKEIVTREQKRNLVKTVRAASYVAK